MQGPLELVDDLRTTLGRLEIALSLVDHAIVWTDRAGTIQWCNRAFDELVERPHIAVLGADIAEVLPITGSDGAPLFPVRDAPVDHGPSERCAFHDRVLEVSVRRTADGETTVVGLRDVTSETRAQEVERELKTRLQAANRELEAFAYSASHDLRAPLRTIDGFSQALLEDFSEQLPPKGRDYLGRVRAAAQRMAQLIDDILQLSRFTRAELRGGEVDLTRIARDVVDELRRAEPEREVEVIVEDGLEAFGDARLLRVVLDNLIRNAWKFTARTEGARIVVGARDEGGGRAFYVRDNGAGFDMTYASKLFVPFQRLHASTEFPGTGVGLAMVQRIVHRHLGRVWAEGEPGRGATFAFTIQTSPSALDAVGSEGVEAR